MDYVKEYGRMVEQNKIQIEQILQLIAERDELKVELKRFSNVDPQNKFKVGDKVRIVRRITGEDGWKNTWSDSMDKYIGASGKITAIDPSGAYIGRCVVYGFPLGSLEHVPEYVAETI